MICMGKVVGEQYFAPWGVSSRLHGFFIEINTAAPEESWWGYDRLLEFRPRFFEKWITLSTG